MPTSPSRIEVRAPASSRGARRRGQRPRRRRPRTRSPAAASASALASRCARAARRRAATAPSSVHAASCSASRPSTAPLTNTSGTPAGSSASAAGPRRRAACTVLIRLRLRVERHLADAREGGAQAGDVDAGAVRRGQQRRLRRVAEQRQLAVGRRARRRRRCTAARPDGEQAVTAGRVPHRRYRAPRSSGVGAGDVDDGDGHPVLGQRAGLVRADDRHRAERLDGGELADERVAAQHPLRADRQREGHDGGQALGDDRHGDADRGEHQLRQRLAGQRAEGDDEEGDGHPAERELLADAVEPLLQRRLRGGDALQHRGDAARARWPCPSRSRCPGRGRR